MSVIGLATVVALTWAPVDWNGIAQARAIQLRPELAAPAKPVKKPAKPEPESSAINAANGETNTADANKNGSDSQPPIIKPIAEKVPNNLDISKYAYDPATESCNADMMMVGDSVTSGTSDAIQAAFPNAFIDGLPNRQLPQAVDVYQQDTAAGHSGSVVVFGLGTNGVISNEQEVQQLIDLTGGKRHTSSPSVCHTRGRRTTTIRCCVRPPRRTRTWASSIGMGIAKVIANTSTMTAFIRI